MRVNIASLVFLAFFSILLGCGSDSSSVDSSDQIADEESSSSIQKALDSEESSSSVKADTDKKTESSSSKKENVKENSSSSKNESVRSSSSSELAEESESSSSELNSSESAQSSSSEIVHESSSSKECWKFLNPDIEYGELVDVRDHQTYKTVKINNRVWMAENLNYDVPGYETYCINESADSCALYGRLYTWAAAVDSVALANDPENPKICGYKETCGIDGVKGICPEGWHLPTYAEWYLLYEYVGGKSVAAKMLRARKGWKKNNGNEDTFGFSGVPAGLWNPNAGEVIYMGAELALWSSTDSDANLAFTIEIRFDDDVGYYFDNVKRLGLAVRCVQDN